MRRKTTLGVIALLGMMLATTGCQFYLGETIRGDGDRIVEQREVESIDSVELRCSADLDIRLGEVEALEIETDANLMEHLETRMEGDKLVIAAVDRANLKPTKGLKIRLTVRSLKSIENAGSGEITAPELSGDLMVIAMSGSGDIDVAGLDVRACDLALSGSGDIRVARLECEDLEAAISGSGGIEIEKGRTRTQDVAIAGSGDYKARGLDSREAEAAIAGSGDMILNVSETLDVEIAGSGDVRYTGSPKVSKSIGGSGSVSHF